MISAVGWLALGLVLGWAIAIRVANRRLAEVRRILAHSSIDLEQLRRRLAELDQSRR